MKVLGGISLIGDSESNVIVVVDVLLRNAPYPILLMVAGMVKEVGRNQ
jgi:hypothetical protein